MHQLRFAIAWKVASAPLPESHSCFIVVPSLVIRSLDIASSAFLDTGRKTKRNTLPPFCLSSVPVVPVPADTPANAPATSSSPRAGPSSSLTLPPGGAVLLRGQHRESKNKKPQNAQPLTEKEMEAKEKKKELKAERGNRRKRTPSSQDKKDPRNEATNGLRRREHSHHHDFSVLKEAGERLRAAEDHLYVNSC
ncbi:hypothetical protein BDP27DRAFT_365520 [Rhodocollybia butyracea]|uniref:Uncharacterized protein n=1 Tax=Rhodocollybia butyracea TaxID=206335 RepID=A0A9P5PDN6_9AGAR|nr:hypothetical protein BDP27DRAFT_365520 [Rhodocollybia butyracea]